MVLSLKALGSAALSLLLCLPVGLARASPLKSDEEVVLFPTAAHLAKDATYWVVPIHAWVFEPEHDSLLRGGVLAATATALGLKRDAVDSDIFRDRAAWFLVDNERGKFIDLTIGPDARNLGPSGPNGHLFAEVHLQRRESGAEPAPFLLTYGVRSLTRAEQASTGQVLFVPREGISVISDIDDTVKVSDVVNKKALLENTFLKPFVAVPGMAALYRDLADRGMVFHFVSSSPWQLYPPLRDFFDRAGLPNGSFHLRLFRFKDEDFLNLFRSSRETKPPVIGSLFDTFPDRDFILIGDSGEADPEIYGDIARAYPNRVRAILIRNVTAETARDPRYTQEAFKDLPSDLWLLFDEAGEARDFLAGRI